MWAASLGRRGCLVSVRSVAVEVVPPAPKLHVSPLEIARLPLLQFPGRILVISSPEEEKRVEELFNGEALLGFDSESRPSSALAQKNRMALIQIASEKVACLWRLGELRSLPPLLRRLLEDRDVHKVSQGAVHELSALKEQWGINPQSFLDLHHIAMHLRTTPRSLQGLVAIFLRRRLSKDQRLTDWQQSPLTQAQIEYAAVDAWAARQEFWFQIPPAMDSDVEAPPSPDPTPPSPRSGVPVFKRRPSFAQSSRRNSGASVQSTGEGFAEVLAQIQALQEKLLHIYEADVESTMTQSKKVLRPMKSFAKQLSVMDATKSATLLNDYHDSLARAALTFQWSLEVLRFVFRGLLRWNVLTGLAKSAHDVTAASMEETLRLGHAAFQVGVERLGRKKSDEKPGVRVAAEDYLSEQALWIRGWKHQGRLEASVESRALHLATTEMKVVLRDHSDALAVTVVYARAFVDAMNALPLSDRSDLPLEQNPMVGQGISEGHRPSRHKVSPEIDCSG
ncbi:Wrn [Symbiodinium microadriaticum]|nr:Wrn [Symbiodinium microadriaticum]